MIEYTLTKDITSYTYPSHMKHPHGFDPYFQKWIPDWKSHLNDIAGKDDVVGIEIGALYGDCSVFCAEKIANGSNSKHIVIDINTNEHLQNNILPYKNIEFLQGNSRDVLKNTFPNDEFADYIFIDGSHMAIDVMTDAVFSWNLLKNNGFLIFDDYGWGIHTTDEKQKPKLAIDSFLAVYKDHYQMIKFGWQVWIKKLNYIYSQQELENNYQ